MRDNSMDRYDDLQVALNVARDNLKSLNEKIGRDQFRFVFVVVVVVLGFRNMSLTYRPVALQGHSKAAALGPGQRQRTAQII